MRSAQFNTVSPFHYPHHDGCIVAPRTPEPKVRRKERGKKKSILLIPPISINSSTQFTALPLSSSPEPLLQPVACPRPTLVYQPSITVWKLGRKKRRKKKREKKKKTSRVSMPQTHCIPSIVVKKKKKSQGVWIFFSLSPSLSLFHRSPFFLLIVVVVGCGCLLGVVWSHRWPCNLTPWRGLKIRALRAGSYICRYNNGVNGSITAAPAMFFFFFFLSSFPPPSSNSWVVILWLRVWGCGANAVWLLTTRICYVNTKWKTEDLVGLLFEN